MKKRSDVDQKAKEAWRLINEFPKQFAQGLSAGEASGVGKVPHEITHVIACGMGGSALAAALFEELRGTGYGIRAPIVVHRDYGLPRLPENSHPVMLTISYSGNTEETLSAYEEARKQELHVIAVTSGGKLAEHAEKEGVHVARIPEGIPPRFATGLQFGALAAVLCKLGLAAKTLPQNVKALERQLDTNELTREGKKIARAAEGRIPLILSSSRLEAVAYSWRTNINENAKIPAWTHSIPEMNHNEVNILARLSASQQRFHKKIAAFVLEDNNEHPSVKQRMAATASFFKGARVPLAVVRTKGASELVRTFRFYLLGLAMSVALAERLGVDPIAVDIIEDLKKQLAKKK